MPVVGSILIHDHLPQVGLHPTQLLFHTAQESMTAQKPPAINDDLSRD